MKNIRHHSGINRSPYEAMFGMKARVIMATPSDEIEEEASAIPTQGAPSDPQTSETPLTEEATTSQEGLESRK